MKLELKHLAPYLPYGLKIETHKIVTTLFSVNPDYGTVKFIDKDREPYNTALKNIKPILRPLSDLIKDEFFNELFILIGGRFKNYKHFKDEMLDNYLYSSPKLMSYRVFELLVSLHFDVFGLIEKGLAVDVNTLKESV